MKKYSGIFRMVVGEGRRTIPELEAYKSFLQNLKDGIYLISVKKLSKKRSLQQNNYYWFVMTLVANELGYDSAEEVHEAMKLLFLMDMTKKLPFVKSTTKLSTAEMSYYMDRVFRYIEDSNDGLGIRVPTPEESYILIANNEGM